MTTLRCAETDWEAFPSNGDVLMQIHRGEIDAWILRGLYAPAEMAQIVARLEAGEHTFPSMRMGDQFEAYSLGQGLDLSPEDLASYLAGVERTTRACESLFRDAGDLETRLTDVFARSAGGRSVSAPRFADGRPYLGIAIHRLPTGGRIPLHCENEQVTRGPYRHLKGLLDGVTLLSFYLTLAPAEEGGELRVYDFGWDDVNETHFHRGRTHVEDLLHDRPFARLTPRAGDLLVFDGGRRFHEVAPVKGAATRWTVGGFLGVSSDGRRVYRWA